VAEARFRIVRHRPDGTLSWRLLATNNRDLGRAPETYPDLASCRAAVVRLRRDVADLRVSVVRAGVSSWGWRLLRGDVVLVVSSRDYQRRIQAEQAAGITVELIPAAELVEP
jgi:hypothetical protein